MQITVEEALKELAPFLGLAGTSFCPNDPDSVKKHLDRLNSIRRTIYTNNQQNYYGTVGWMEVDFSTRSYCYNAYGQSYTMPIYIDSIISAASINSDVVFVGQNYRLMPKENAMFYSSGRYRVNVLELVQLTEKPPLANNPNKRFSFFIRSQVNEDNQELTIKAMRGNMVYFQKIKLNGIEWVGCEEGVDKIIEVTKPITGGDIDVVLSGCDNKPTEILLATWPAGLKNPRHCMVSAKSLSAGENHHLLVYYRKKFIELTNLDELVDIESIEALKFGSKAANHMRSDNEAYSAAMSLMFKHLQVVDFVFKSPEEAVDVHPLYDVERAFEMQTFYGHPVTNGVARFP